MDNAPTPPSASQLANDVSNQAKGFFASLLDFSFESFVTPKIIKVIYFILLIGVALGALGILISAISQGFVAVLISLIVIPIMVVLGAVAIRVYVEIIMLAFKVLETLQRIESKQK